MISIEGSSGGLAASRRPFGDVRLPTPQCRVCHRSTNQQMPRTPHTTHHRKSVNHPRIYNVAGQAVQNFNIMNGFDPETGLMSTAVYP